MVRGQRQAPAALYPQEKPGTHCTRGWVGPRAGLDRCGKSGPPTGIRSPDRPARSQSLYRLSYRGPLVLLKRCVQFDWVETQNSILWKENTSLSCFCQHYNLIPSHYSNWTLPALSTNQIPIFRPLSYGVPVRERYGSTLLPATREQHDHNCTQSH